MNQESFEARHAELWADVEASVQALSSRRTAKAAAADLPSARRFPALYRKLCHHVALARARRYSLTLQQRLNRLALDGHRHLYRPSPVVLSVVATFFAHDFPRAARQHIRFLAVSTVLFVISGLCMGIAVSLDDQLIYSLLDGAQVAQLEAMYDPTNRVLGAERDSATDTAMFGHYIFNNISIGFQTFAGGLLFGVGSVAVLCFNGVFIGAVAGHLTTAGLSDTFWPFVVGHSSLELTALVIFGAVGLSIGYSGLAPADKSRWHAIRVRAIEAMPLIYGATAMLIAAAFVEAYWSSSTVPSITTKYVVGGVLWACVVAYFALRRRES